MYYVTLQHLPIRLHYTIDYFTCTGMAGSNMFFSAIERQVSFKPEVG